MNNQKSDIFNFKKEAPKPTSKFTEAWLPIRSIMNGMIQTDNGYYVTGVKVQPKNIFILDQTSEDNVINNFRNLYNSIDYEFWLIIADRPVDIDVYLSHLQILYNNVVNPKLRKYIVQDINKANLFMGNQLNVVDTEYYFIFKDKKPDILQKRIQFMITALANCSLSSAQTSNDDLRMLMDNFLNGGNSYGFGTVITNE